MFMQEGSVSNKVLRTSLLLQNDCKQRKALKKSDGKNLRNETFYSNNDQSSKTVFAKLFLH